jgi:enoyl-CoA hydratase/carnithine racemase
MSETILLTKQLNEFVEWAVVEEIGIITLNNPPQNYLVTPDFISVDLLEKEIRNSSIKGIIFEGKGRHFSAGADLKELRKLAGDPIRLQKDMTKGKELLEYIDQLPIPVISAIRGVCLGGGLEIALASHIILCAETSLFAFPEVNYNLMPGLGGSFRLSRRIGIPESLTILLSGDIIDAPTAFSLKLVDQVLPASEVKSQALNLMKKMVTGKLIKVINNIVRSIKNSQTMSLQQAMKEETTMFCDLAVDEINRNKSLKSE